MKSYANQTAFITGGGSGIGRALAKALSAGGARVCVADISLAAAQSVANECGANAKAVSVDVRDAVALKNCIESLLSG